VLPWNYLKDNVADGPLCGNAAALSQQSKVPRGKTIFCSRVPVMASISVLIIDMEIAYQRFTVACKWNRQPCRLAFRRILQ
jgi:hypothetical protein